LCFIPFGVNLVLFLAAPSIFLFVNISGSIVWVVNLIPDWQCAKWLKDGLKPILFAIAVIVILLNFSPVVWYLSKLELQRLFNGLLAEKKVELHFKRFKSLGFRSTRYSEGYSSYLWRELSN